MDEVDLAMARITALTTALDKVYSLYLQVTGSDRVDWCEKQMDKIINELLKEPKHD